MRVTTARLGLLGVVAGSLAAGMGVADGRLADGPGPCGPGAGSCFEPHPTPGCELPECCDLVCAVDPFCCTTEWDPNCVSAAQILCEIPPVCGQEGDCFAVHEAPGCQDTFCCEVVCNVDPFCCDRTWDGICVDEALLLCGRRRCDHSCTAQLEEPEPCGESENNGCDVEPPQFTPINCGESYCGSVWADLLRDIDWYELVVTRPTRIQWTVTAEFPAEVTIIVGDCATGFSTVALVYGGFCAPATVEIDAAPGTYYLTVAPGTPVAPIFHGISCLDSTVPLLTVPGRQYEATVTCLPLEQPGRVFADRPERDDGS